jgi:1-deoxy-D-xylulose-5-phosphate reductoisomerase
VLNAANEVAVEAFLARRIGFLAIVALVEATLAASPDLVVSAPVTVEGVLAVDSEARARAGGLLGRFALAG